MAFSCRVDLGLQQTLSPSGQVTQLRVCPVNRTLFGSAVDD